MRTQYSEFLVYVPTTASRTAGNPVFLNFHGYLMSMEWQYELTGMPIVRRVRTFPVCPWPTPATTVLSCDGRRARI